MVEQGAHNAQVTGSIPVSPTKRIGLYVQMNKQKLPQFDNLEHFLDYVLNEMPITAFVPLQRDPIVRTAGDETTGLVYGFCLFNNGEYQLEMWGAPGETTIYTHKHPDVDSYEVFMGGELKFHMNGKELEAEDYLHIPDVWYNGTHPMRTATNHFKPDTLHGGTAGKRGAIFLSVQRWLNGVKPVKITENYDVRFMSS